jgi:hypothetical protein
MEAKLNQWWEQYAPIEGFDKIKNCVINYWTDQLKQNPLWNPKDNMPEEVTKQLTEKQILEQICQPRYHCM